METVDIARTPNSISPVLGPAPDQPVDLEALCPLQQESSRDSTLCLTGSSTYPTAKSFSLKELFRRNKLTALPPRSRLPTKSEEDRYLDLKLRLAPQLCEAHRRSKGPLSPLSVKLEVRGSEDTQISPYLMVYCDEKIAGKIWKLLQHPRNQQEMQATNSSPAFKAWVVPRAPAPVGDGGVTNIEIKIDLDSAGDTICGAKLMCENGGKRSIATLGGLVCVRINGIDEVFALTVAHLALSESHEPTTVNTDSDISDDSDQISLRSKSSAASVHCYGDPSTVGYGTEVFENDSYQDLPVTTAQTSDGPTTAETDSSGDTTKWGLFGEVYCASTALNNRENQNIANLDWALLRIREEYLFDVGTDSGSDGKGEDKILSQRERVFSFEQHRNDETSREMLVTVQTSPRVDKTGILSQTKTFVLLPPGLNFTEVYCLRFNNGSDVQQGDCGSWVLLRSGSDSEVVGVIVARDASGDIYIVPLETILSQIQTVTGADAVSVPLQAAMRIQSSQAEVPSLLEADKPQIPSNLTERRLSYDIGRTTCYGTSFSEDSIVEDTLSTSRDRFSQNFYLRVHPDPALQRLSDQGRGKLQSDTLKSIMPSQNTMLESKIRENDISPLDLFSEGAAHFTHQDSPVRRRPRDHAQNIDGESQLVVMSGSASDSLTEKDFLVLLKSLPSLRELSQKLRVPLTCVSFGGPQSLQTISFFNDTSQVPSNPVDSLGRRTSHDSPVVPADIFQSIESDIADNNRGNRIFEIASLGKLYVNLLFCILIDGNGEEKASKDLNWEADAFELLNMYRKIHGKREVPRLKLKTTVLDILLHRNAFPRMQDFLLSYDGKFMPSEEQFLDHAANWANSKEYDGRNSYSKCNTIFAALLVQEIFDKPFGQLINERLFIQVGMTRTSMDPRTIRDWHENKLVTKGYHVSTDLKQVALVEKSVKSMSVLETVAFRCHSCINDISKLIQQLFRALANDRECFIKPAVAQQFFARSHTPVSYTHAGFFGYLDSDLPGSDSLNVHSRPLNNPTSYQLGKSYLGLKVKAKEEYSDQLRIKNWLKRKGKALRSLIHQKMGVFGEPGERIEVYYKGGVVDGFTCSIYILQQYQYFAVAFSNATGPLDFTDYACQAVLQDILALDPYINIAEKVLEIDLPVAQAHLKDREMSDEVLPPLTEEIKKFEGIYVHHYNFCTIEVTAEGQFVKEAENRSVMQARVVDGKLRIFPGDIPFCVDRRYGFAKVEFEIMEQGGKIKLRDGNGGFYSKLPSSGILAPTDV